MLIKRLLVLIFFSVPFFHGWAQSPCPKDYGQIGQSCITSLQLNYSEKPIVLSDELTDQIFFFKTSSGEVGKLKVLATTVQPRECTLFLDAVTFGNTAQFTPNASITISVDRNHWLKRKIYLDREGFSALELVRETKGAQGRCVLTLSKGTQFARYKKQSDQILREENLLLLYGPLVLVFIAIFIVVRLFLDEQDKYKTQEALEEAENATKGKQQQLFVRITKPFYKRYFLPVVQGSKNKQAIKNRYRQKLANAGLAKEMSPEEFVALKFFMIIGGPFAFLSVRWILDESWDLSITPVTALIGYFYPNFWLDGLIKQRNAQILRSMPFIVDLLALSVEAGLDFMAAIQRVIEKAPPGPLVEEFETLIRETKIGSTRAEGLRQLSWRVNLIEINSFCATLIAADSVGASIGPLLKQQSVELRVKRTAMAEQKGATAATRILVPMIFFILPAVLIAIFVPMLLQMMNDGSSI